MKVSGLPLLVDALIGDDDAVVAGTLRQSVKRTHLAGQEVDEAVALLLPEVHRRTEVVDEHEARRERDDLREVVL